MLVMKEKLGIILSSFSGEGRELIPVLQKVQDEMGYLSPEAMLYAAEFLKIPPSNVFGVASFYEQFRFSPVGKKMVMVCQGTACHVKGAEKVMNEISRHIGIKKGQTSEDMEYTLKGVTCIGCCALAPCITINDDVHGRLTPKLIEKLFIKKPVNKKTNE